MKAVKFKENNKKTLLYITLYYSLLSKIKNAMLKKLSLHKNSNFKILFEILKISLQSNIHIFENLRSVKLF